MLARVFRQSITQRLTTQDGYLFEITLLQYEAGFVLLPYRLVVLQLWLR